MRVGFLQQRLPLDFQLHDAALDFVDFDGKRIDLHAQRGRGFVDQVDGLVGQEAIGDIAMGKRGRGDDRGILDAHAVMHFVAVLEAAQDGDGVLDRRLRDQNGLEAALQRRVLFDVLAIFVERGGADGAQFAAGQRRLEHVGGVHGAFGGARADQRVQLVDEENDLSGGFGDFLQHGLQAIFKFAAVLGAGDQGRQVQRHDALGLQHLGHVARDDALRQAFDDGGLADAGFADQHRIVLGAPREDLHDAADFDVAADHRIEFAAAGQFGEVARVLFERAEGGFRVCEVTRWLPRTDASACRIASREAPWRDSRCAAGIGFPGGDGQQDMLGGNVLVLEFFGFIEGLFEHLIAGFAQVLLRDAAHFRQARNLRFESRRRALPAERPSG